MGKEEYIRQKKKEGFIPIELDNIILVYKRKDVAYRIQDRKFHARTGCKKNYVELHVKNEVHPNIDYQERLRKKKEKEEELKKKKKMGIVKGQTLMNKYLKVLQ